jgi:molybdate transport system regulatory protein
MNKLEGIIIHITSQDDLSLIDLKVDNDLFTTILINSDDIDYLKTDNKVFILFKETEVSIAKNLSGILSIRNKMRSKVKEILKGKILTKVVLDYKDKSIISIITTRSVNELDLQIGDEVDALVKTNEVSIMKA